MDGHLGFWELPSWNFAGHAVPLEIVGFEECVYQFSRLYHHLIDLRINVTNVLLSSICESTYMLYLKSRSRYRHVLGTKPSVMANFVLTFNTFMGCKINAFQVMKEKPHFWADILDFGSTMGRQSWHPS